MNIVFLLKFYILCTLCMKIKKTNKKKKKSYSHTGLWPFSCGSCGTIGASVEQDFYLRLFLSKYLKISCKLPQAKLNKDAGSVRG